MTDDGTENVTCLDLSDKNVSSAPSTYSLVSAAHFRISTLDSLKSMSGSEGGAVARAAGVCSPEADDVAATLAFLDSDGAMAAVDTRVAVRPK